MAGSERTATMSGHGEFLPETILQQAQIQDVALSPDGATVVYSRRVIEGQRYLSHLWLVPWAGGAARQLTHAIAIDRYPEFSPDGRTLLFISDRGGRKQPWLLPLDGGEAALAVDIPGDTTAAHWSPDGRSLLLVASSGVERLSVDDANDPTARVIDDFSWRLDPMGYRNQLVSAWVTPPRGGEPRRVSDPSWEILDARWHPDGEQIVVVADAEADAGMRRFSEAAAVWALSVSGSDQPRLLAALPGGVVAVRPAPAGDRLAVIGKDIPRQPSWADHHLHLVDGGSLRRLGAALDRPVENVTTGDPIVRGNRFAAEWLDGQTLVAQVGDEGRCLPYRFDAIPGIPEPLVSCEIVRNAIAVADRRIAIVASDRGTPTEIYAIEDGGLRRITTNGADWLEPYRRDPVRHRVHHEAGHAIDVWSIEGSSAPRPGPTIIQIHGGPHAAHGPTPWLEMPALADAGFHVLYANPRGSSGYGEAFAHAAHGDWGRVSSSDVLAVVDWAVAEGIADPGRIGVMGLSFGGYLTTWLLGRHPGRFAAAVSENPVSNWVSWFGGSDLQGYTDERFVGIGKLPEDVDAFLAASPFMQIHQNRAPLLLLQSEADLRCPPEQSETLFTILRSRGVPARLVRYPGEAHFLAGIGRPSGASIACAASWTGSASICDLALFVV